MMLKKIGYSLLIYVAIGFFGSWFGGGETGFAIRLAVSVVAIYFIVWRKTESKED